MRAAVLVGTNRIEVEQRVVPGDGVDPGHIGQRVTVEPQWPDPDSAETMTLPTQLIQNRELALTGVFRYADTWPTALALVESGRVDLDAMVTARYPLEKVGEALDSDRLPGTVKTVVTRS
jgi:threonine dehydrogenase-like Zn-dependent dehydrogenase